MHAITLLGMLLASVLSPVRTWTPPDAPLKVNVKADGDARLVLTRFGSLAELASKDVSGESTQDLKQLFPQLNTPGTYILYQVPKGKQLAEFTGTPLVIRTVEDGRFGAGGGPMVIKMEPLKYAVMTTKQGPITLAFYYDVAPITVTSFLTLAEQGYYDDLTFHRIIHDFMIQGGDPRGNGTGGPGYTLPDEFSDRPHLPGVLSMAHTNEPNSGGSQFFICLNYDNTKHLDHKYTAFGKVTAGMDAVKTIGSVPVSGDKPNEKQVIEKVEVKPVTAAENPYATLFKSMEPAGK